MEQLTVFFLCMSEYGHVMPIRHLIREFSMRGYRVIVYASETFGNIIEDSGGEFIACDIYEIREKYQRSNLGESFSDQLYFAENINERMGKDIEKYKPAFAVVDEGSIWGKLIVEKYRIPFVISSPTIPLNLVTLSDYCIDIYKSIEPAINEIQQHLDMMSEKSFPKKTFLSLLLLNEQTDCIFYQTKTFLPCQNTFNLEHIFFAGACGREKTTDLEKPFLLKCLQNKKSRPFVFVTMGTISSLSSSFWITCIKAFKGKNIDVVMVVWKYVNEEIFSQMPDNIAIVREADQRQYLKYADVCVCHGGLNTVSDCLWEGVPMALYPMFADQYANARITAEEKAGILMENHRPDTIWKTVNELLNNDIYRLNAQLIHEKMMFSGSTSDAADWILKRKGYI
ncbi:MAG: hypothetical protein IJ583_01370 [Firmicutes bacterium]|nr:hypothetical protein [Bacillota bacterium]